MVGADADVEPVREDEHELHLAGGLGRVDLHALAGGDAVDGHRMEPRRRHVGGDPDAVPGDLVPVEPGKRGTGRRRAHVEDRHKVQRARGRGGVARCGGQMQRAARATRRP